MKDNFDLEVSKILKEAEKEMYDLNHPYVGSEHMLLGILKISTTLKKILEDYDLTYEIFKKELINVVGCARKKSSLALYTPLLKRIIADAIEEAEETNNGKVKPEHLLIGMLEEGEGVGIRILINMEINLDDLYNDLIKNSNNKKNKNTVLMDIGKLMIPKKEEKIFKRDKEIENLIEILLRKNKNNPLLLGEAGVGKTAIVEELARRISCEEVPEFLLNYKIIELDTGSLISGTRYRGEFEDRLNKIIKETISEQNTIIFIDEIHTLVNCGGAEGAIDAANILKPYLARGSLKIIGATTLKEYKQTIYKDKALDRRFQIINVEEPSLKDTEFILKNIRNNYEKHHNVIISDENIKDIIKYSDKYIYNRYNPDKAIDILDSVCAHVQMSRPNKKNALSTLREEKEKFLINKQYKEALEIELRIKNLIENSDKIQITTKDILKIVEYRANIPVLDNFNEKINQLSKTIKSHIYGQDKAIEEICETLKEKYLIDNSKPLSILIQGSKGVGKTSLAKEIANNLFGTKQFLKLDMSELSGEGAINKLIGTTQGYIGYEDECLLSKVKDYPYSLILLDEVEKSSLKVQNLFLEILENGEIRTGKGETLHFENTTIIMTTNISNKDQIGFKKENYSSNEIASIPLIEKVEKVINLNKIDKNAAKKFIKRETENMILNKEEIEKIISTANIHTTGMRGIQKELNKYKIHKLLTKV